MTYYDCAHSHWEYNCELTKHAVEILQMVPFRRTFRGR